MSHVEAIARAFSAATLPLCKGQAGQLAVYLELLLEWNERMNLTAITEPASVIEKHFIDCAMLLNDLPAPQDGRRLSLMDVGSGAGFPGFVVAALREDIDVTCLDSLQKRIGFLTALQEAMGLRNISALLHGRAEDLGRDAAYRERYDIVTSRAVAAMPKLLEYTLPFTAVGGCVIAMKGADADAEAADARHAATVLGAAAPTVRHFTLPGGDERGNVTYVKVQPTGDTYPRRAKAIDRKPL